MVEWEDLMAIDEGVAGGSIMRHGLCRGGVPQGAEGRSGPPSRRKPLISERRRRRGRRWSSGSGTIKWRWSKVDDGGGRWVGGEGMVAGGDVDGTWRDLEGRRRTETEP